MSVFPLRNDVTIQPLIVLPISAFLRSSSSRPTFNRQHANPSVTTTAVGVTDIDLDQRKPFLQCTEGFMCARLRL